MKKLKLKLSALWTMIRSCSFYFADLTDDELIDETQYGVIREDLLEIKKQIEKNTNENT